MSLAGMGFLSAIAQVASKVGEAAWARNSANHAYRQSVNSATHAHQWEMQDLKAAGLNPILTANAGASAAPFMGQTPTIDLAESMQRGAQTALAESQKDLQRSQAVLNYANSASLVKGLDKIDQDIAESRQRQSTGQAQQSWFTQQIAESMERSKNYPAMARLLGAQASNQLSMAGLNSANAFAQGMQNDFWKYNPHAFGQHMRYGTGNPFASAGQLGVSLGNLAGSLYHGIGGAIRDGSRRLGSWLDSYGNNHSSQSVLENSGLPF